MEVKLSEVPMTWHCKACQLQIDKGKQQSKEWKILADHPHGHSKGTDECLFEMPVHKTVLPPTSKVGIHKFKGPPTGKVKFLPTEAILGMRTRGRPKASSMHSGRGPRPNNVDVSYNPLSRRNPAVCTIASPGSANQKSLAQESPRHSKLPAFANMQPGTRNSQSKSFPGQTLSPALESSGMRKTTGRSENLRRLSSISNKEISAGSSENFLKIKEEDKPEDHRVVNDNNKDSIGAPQSLGKRKNRPEDQMRVHDATNKVNSTCASQRLEKRQTEEDRPACAGVSSVLNKEKSIGGLEDLGIRRMKEGGAENCTRIMDVAEKDKSTGDSKSPGKGKIKEDEPEDDIKVMHASNIEEPTGAPKSSEKRKIEEDPGRFLEKNGLLDGILSHTHGTSESKLVSEQEEFLNPPATKASWNGSFAVADIFGRNGVKDTYDGLRAHLPRKVSRKVYEVAKKLPKMVKLQLYRRCEMCPHIFIEDGPSKYDIALYFLPGALGRSIDYFYLLELIEKEDMMMRSFIGGVELLLFSSKLLPLNSQTFKAQLYLWGIFRSRKGPSATSKPNEREIPVPFAMSRTDQDPTYIRATQENDAVQDMEIDMIGGVDVGRVNIPLRKQTFEGREMPLRKETAKFSFSNSLIFKRKSAESHGREIGGDNARTTDCNNQIATSLPRLSFKLHGRKMIDQSVIQDWSKDFERLSTSHQTPVVKKEHVDSSARHSQLTKNDAPNENREELLVKSSSSSSTEFPPGFTKPVKLEVPPSCSNEPFKIGSPNVVRVNSRRFSELPRMS
ncbi:hypothetical protein Scep_016978 [Stephania cephalantha]|uniref:AIPP2-like SPOC-like domain-containing protein n=1 Tax=Stephania cephalantha TaxID=152367 RepID=A0AAP0NV73_9MAGN